MKKLIYFGLFFCLHICVAQSDADYGNTMKTIIESYNANDAQKIFDQFSTDLQATFTIDKVKEFVTKTLENQGKFSEFDFMDNDGGNRYLVQSESDSIILVITLSADLKLTKFAVE
ncbi:hypothetical protein D1818_03770 [Aquimarina sp. BL5]|uniref:hypothetical protein n=1 Tax=Aquimarina sp. BL5 TaxID=1714860 RepID=UPI000E511F66|nr:hypothetical protein [Aquimarina sp. BL5]AXT49986.1 hypothetical protein D1818_03770 [Aquimarina sp. BL5]RKM90821.1 hypothetical protein D7036_23845 [Aquimarina sp. BL5]